jgi:hypothetical protein
MSAYTENYLEDAAALILWATCLKDKEIRAREDRKKEIAERLPEIVGYFNMAENGFTVNTAHCKAMAWAANPDLQGDIKIAMEGLNLHDKEGWLEALDLSPNIWDKLALLKYAQAASVWPLSKQEAQTKWVNKIKPEPAHAEPEPAHAEGTKEEEAITTEVDNSEVIPPEENGAAHAEPEPAHAEGSEGEIPPEEQEQKEEPQPRKKKRTRKTKKEEEVKNNEEKKPRKKMERKLLKSPTGELKEYASNWWSRMIAKGWEFADAKVQGETDSQHGCGQHIVYGCDSSCHNYKSFGRCQHICAVNSNGVYGFNCKMKQVTFTVKPGTVSEKIFEKRIVNKNCSDCKGCEFLELCK